MTDGHPHTDYSELSQESSVKAEIDRMIIEAKEQEASELGLTKPSAVFKAPRLVEVPWGSQVEMLVDIAMCKYIYCNFELPQEIPHFEPCYYYRASVAMNAAYEMMLLLPQTNWPEIIDLANQLQPPEVRDEIYAISKPRHANEAGILAKGNQAWWVSYYPLVMSEISRTHGYSPMEKKETTSWGYLV
jgi:hypothetical protein